MKSLILVLIIGLMAIQTTAQKVTNVAAKQGSESIVVSYKIEGGYSDIVYKPYLYYSTDGGANYNKCRSTKVINGKPNQTNQITWTVTKDLEYFGGKNIVFKVNTDGFYNFVIGTAIINGKKYKTIKIDDNEWMAENLNLDTDGSWCYDNKPSNCNKYGRLYTWSSANSAAKRTDGWGLPSKRALENRDKFIEKLNVSSQIKKSGMNVQNGGRYEKHKPDRKGVFSWLNSGNFFWASNRKGSMRALMYSLDNTGNVWDNRLKYEYDFNGLSVRLVRYISSQDPSGVSSKYNFNIYSKKGKAVKIAKEKREAGIKKVKEERNLAFKNALSKNTIDAYEQFLGKKYSDKQLNDQAIESILLLTPNTIVGYEQFLSKKYRSKKLNNQAIASIYKHTAQIDAVEGYRSFLKKYPNSADAEKATTRLYEIMYAIAEEENDIASYYGFLVQFPKAQVLLRDKAFINMQMLEVEKATNEYNEAKSNDDDHELKERVARQLYVEAIRAKESGDQYTFMRKYNTVLYSDLFKDTQAAFDLFRDKELAKLIRELRDEIRQNTYAINRMTSAITNKLNEIQNNISSLQSTIASSQNDYSMYFERMIDIQREQASDWSKYVNTGKAPSGWFGSPKSY